MSSFVWKYFIIDPESENASHAKCNICSKSISRGVTKSTSSLSKHLLKIHDIKISNSLDPPPSKLSKLESFNFKHIATTQSTANLSQPLVVEIQQNAQDTKLDIKKGSNFHNLSSPGSSTSLNSNEAGSSRPKSSQSTSEQDESLLVASTSIQTSLLESPSPTSLPSPVYPRAIARPKGTFQPTIQQVFDRSKKFASSDPRAKDITKLIAAMICLDIQPFSIVENRGFRRLISHLEPRYTIPSRKLFSNKIIPDMYHAVHAGLIEELSGANHVSLTTDMWTSISGTDYMALTCHFYIEDSEKHIPQHKCLDVVPFTEVSHSAINLKNFLCELIERWGITNKVVAIVRDNGPDIKAAIALTKFPGVPCTAHTLQLVVKDGFLTNPKVINLITKCKKLVGSFKHSAKNSKILRRCQKQLGSREHRLIQDEPTRWNSTYHMMIRLKEQKSPIIMTCASSEVKVAAELTADDWRTLQYFTDILEIFETVTLQLSKESSSISEIIPMIKLIQYKLKMPAPQGSGLQGLKNDLLSSLKIRFTNLESDRLLGPATPPSLDPRFKGNAFETEAGLAAAKESLINEMETAGGLTSETSPLQPISTIAGDPPNAHSGKGLWSQYKELVSEAFHVEETCLSASDEFQQYLSEPTLNPEDHGASELGAYWQNSHYCRLRKVACKLLCIPPATVFSERMFSTAGSIADTKRNRLDPERVKMLVFLNKNLD